MDNTEDYEMAFHITKDTANEYTQILVYEKNGCYTVNHSLQSSTLCPCAR